MEITDEKIKKTRGRKKKVPLTDEELTEKKKKTKK